MTELKQRSDPRNPKLSQNARTSRHAVRRHRPIPKYSLAQAEAFAAPGKRRFGQYRGNYPNGARSCVEQSGFSLTVRAVLERLYRGVITYCLHFTQNGYIQALDLRATLKAKGVCRSNVTTYVGRMLQVGILKQLTPTLYKVCFYNCGTQQRQDLLVQEMNSRPTKTSVKSATYGNEKAYTPRDKSLRVCDSLASRSQTKKNLSPLATAASDGIGNRIMPAAKQGLVLLAGHETVVLPQSLASDTPSPTIETSPKEQGEREKSIFANLPEGFAVPEIRDFTPREKEAERLDRLRVNNGCEATNRGYTRAWHAAQRYQYATAANVERRKSKPLVPIRATSFTPSVKFVGSS